MFYFYSMKGMIKVRKKFYTVIFLVLILLFLVSCSGSDNNSNGNDVGVNSSESDIAEIDSMTESNSVIEESKDISSKKDTTKNNTTVVETTKAESVSDNETKNEEKKGTTDVDTVEMFTVTFEDYDGTVLKTENIEKGKSATAPEKPVRDGYRFVKWDTSYENVKVDITVTAVYEEITLPSLIVDEVTGKKGDTVAVKVNMANNPGILAMLLNITYDENVMKLKKVKNGSLMDDYMFTPPKNLKSGCNAAWNINDIPDGDKDGELIVLYFDVSRKAEKGSYPISVSCLNNAFDNDYNIVPFEMINGAIVIE